MRGVLRVLRQTQSLVVFLAAVVGLSADASLAESQPGCLDCRAADEHAAFATFYDLKSFEASLILNNKGPDPLPVEATVFSLRGERLDLGEWELEASSAVAVSLNEVLAPYPNRFRQGSLELRYRYDGCPLVLSAGLILEDRAAGVGFDELLARPAGFASNRLEAVWWAPSSRARMELVVANRSERVVTAAIAVRSLGAEAERRELEVTLGPRETRVVNVPRAMTIGGFGRERWAAGSATVEHTGDPGDVAARGRIEDRAVRYATVVEFSDPEAGLGNELHGTGLRLGRFEGRALVPTLVVRNAAEEPSEVTIRLPWTDAWGETRAAELDPVVLEPGEVRELSRELLDLVGGLPTETMRSAGLELRYSTAPGTVLAAAQSVSLDGEYAFRVPLVDALTKGSAGNYPWRLDGATTTTVYLKNTSGEVRNYTVQVDFEGGAYVLGLRELEPGETFALDLRELRDGEEPDQHGTTIPPDAASGQVHWSMIGAENHTMVGRAEYVDRVHGLATTFACSSCCPDSFSGALISPENLWLPITSYQQLLAYQLTTDCYGVQLLPFLVNPSSWWSDHPPILGVNSGGGATGLSPGGTAARASWHVCTWWFQQYPQNACVSHCFYTNPSGPASVWDFSILFGADSIIPNQVQEPGSDQTSVTIQVNPPGPGLNVSLSLDVEANSGGHTAGHTGERPTGWLLQNGGSTNSQGRFETLYQSPTVSGFIKVNATVTSSGGQHQKHRFKHLIVEVPGLSNLPSGSNYYKKQQDNKHGNGNYHYGKLATRQAIVSAANHFWNNWGKDQSPQMGMVINDQSLVLGGLFDLAGNWTTNPGHSQHREGRHVDITFRVWTGGSNIPKVDPNYCELPEQSVCSEAMQRLGQALSEAFANCPIHSPGTQNAHWHCEK